VECIKRRWLPGLQSTALGGGGKARSSLEPSERPQPWGHLGSRPLPSRPGRKHIAAVLGPLTVVLGYGSRGRQSSSRRQPRQSKGTSSLLSPALDLFMLGSPRVAQGVCYGEDLFPRARRAHAGLQFCRRQRGPQPMSLPRISERKCPYKHSREENLQTGRDSTSRAFCWLLCRCAQGKSPLHCCSGHFCPVFSVAGTGAHPSRPGASCPGTRESRFIPEQSHIQTSATSLLCHGSPPWGLSTLSAGWDNWNGGPYGCLVF
jgi:hypothetical protein